MRTIPARSAMSRIAPLLALATGIALATTASADWPAGGMLVCSPGNFNGMRNARIIDMPSGDLCVIGVGNGNNTNYFVVQRVSRSGVIGSGWPAGGVPFSFVLRGLPVRVHSFVVDDASRTWHSWDHTPTSLQSVAADASAAPLPAGSTYNLGSLGSGPSGVAPAPGGEVFVTCGSNRLKRITATGAAAAGWSINGIGLPGTSYDDNDVLPDGSGGVVVFMRSISGGSTPIATRIDGNRLTHAGWDGAGLSLSNVAGAVDIDHANSQLLPSGPDHALAVWSPDGGSGARRLMMQRFSLGGTLDPAWPEDGIEVVAPDTLIACRALADGSGGAYVVRQSHGHPVATHVSAAGTMLASDVEFVDAGAQYVPSPFSGGALLAFPDDMIADVTPDGGLLVGWNDARLAPARSFRLRWLTPSLAPAAGKPDTGLVYLPGSPHPTAALILALHADGTDAAFIAWGDYHDVGGSQNYGDLGGSQIDGDVWMTRVQAPALVGVGPVVPHALALSAPRPNPARGSVALDVTLPDDSPARVELIDIAGRVVRSQVVQGAGPHAVSFNDVALLAPGLYFARAVGRAGESSARVVLSR